jgi:hypothetical protein
MLTACLLFSCKSTDISKDLFVEYTNLDSLCDKVDFFEKNLNTKRKQLKNHISFSKIISDIENRTNINSTTVKGIGGISYTSNQNIKKDIEKWKIKCKE